MHREILTNLQEGLQFYADLTKMVGEVREQSRVVSLRFLPSFLLARGMYC